MIIQDISIEIGTTPNIINVTCTDATGNAPFDLVGCTVSAKVKDRSGNMILDLLPTISDEPGGVITIAVTDEQTAILKPNPKLNWDLILQLSTGVVLPAIMGGVAKIERTVTL